MKRGEGFNIAAVAIALTLSVCLAAMSNANVSKAVASTLGSIKRVATAPVQAGCLLLPIDATGANGWPSYR